MSENSVEGDDGENIHKNQMDELMVELMGMSKEELASELYAFKRVWECIDEETKYLISNMGQMFSITQRNYNTKVGILTKVFFTPARFFISTYEKLYDATSGGYVSETKEWSVLANMVMAYARIYEREFEND